MSPQKKEFPESPALYHYAVCTRASPRLGRARARSVVARLRSEKLFQIRNAAHDISLFLIFAIPNSIPRRVVLNLIGKRKVQVLYLTFEIS